MKRFCKVLSVLNFILYSFFFVKLISINNSNFDFKTIALLLCSLVIIDCIFDVREAWKHEK